MTTDKHNDLDWLAFCYAAGELDAGQAESFEGRLADEQAAREALAGAVELTQTVAAAEAQSGDFVVPASRERSDWNRRLSWMAVGGLASLLLAMLWSGVVGPTWRSTQKNLAAASKYQLAMAWNQTRDEFAGVHEFSGVQEAGLWLPSDADDELRLVGFSEDEEAVADAPSWMMAALYTEPAAAGPDAKAGLEQ